MLTDGDWSAVWLSIKVAVACVVVLAVPGTVCGWLLARWSFRGKTIVDALVHIPLVLPPVVTGYLLLSVLGRNGLLGGWLADWGIRLPFSFAGAVLASGVMAFPLMVRSVRVAVDLVDRKLEAAALTLGATPLRVFLTVTLPLAGPGVLTGLLLAFARSLGEFGATISFAGNIAGETRTIPLAIYSYMQVPGGETSAGWLAAVSIALSLGALIASEYLARRMRRQWGETDA